MRVLERKVTEMEVNQRKDLRKHEYECDLDRKRAASGERESADDEIHGS